MEQQESPDDYVIATNETRTVKEFVEISFSKLVQSMVNHNIAIVSGEVINQ